MGTLTITRRTAPANTTTADTVAMAAIAPLLKLPPFFDGLVGVLTPNTTVRGEPVEPLQSHVTEPDDDVVVHPTDDHVFVVESYC